MYTPRNRDLSRIMMTTFQSSPQRHVSPWITAPIAIGLLGALAYVDVITPPDLSLALFYLLPVAAATWLSGRGAGYLVASAGALIWLIADLQGAAGVMHISFAYWNALSRFAFFIFSVPILSSWRTQGDRLAKMVAERTMELTAEVAERQRAEAALRQLAAQLSAAEDAERCRVAYDLHDGLAQMLSLLKMNLETAVAGSGPAAPQAERFADSVRMVDELIHQTRNLTFELHPAMLDDLGLVATLHGYVRDFGQRAAIEVTVSEQGTSRPLPATMAHFLFRAVKELMNNAARHGKASEIVAAVHWEPKRLRVVVDDDGCGFDFAALPERSGPRGLGLPGIAERLISLGGDMHVESGAGQGTRVILEAPLEAAGIPPESSQSGDSLPARMTPAAGKTDTLRPVHARAEPAKVR